jgi:hypothetical protein
MVSIYTAVDEGEETPFNGFEGQPIDWADPPEELPSIDWTDSTCVHPPATTPEESNPFQAAECHRNTILQHTATILMDQITYPKSPKVLSASRRDTSPNSQHHETERQHCLCRCAKGTEGSEEHGRGCQERQGCKIQKRKKDRCECPQLRICIFDDRFACHLLVRRGRGDARRNWGDPPRLSKSRNRVLQVWCGRLRFWVCGAYF